jgi:CRP-like cAMP-binding protein
MEGSIYGQIRDALSKAGFFKFLKIEELDLFIKKLKIRYYLAGDEVVKQGDPGDSFYIIAEGRVDILVRKGFAKKKVAELGPGEFFGEMSLMTHEKRSATVLVSEKALLFILYKSDFESILLKNPAIAQVLRQAVAERKLHAN